MHLNFTSILHKHMDFLFLIANTVFSILRKNSNTIPGWMEIIWWEYRKQYSYSNVPTIKSMSCCCCYVTSVVSDSVRPQGQQPTRLRHPWDSPGKNTGVGCPFLLQWIKVKMKSLSCVQLSATPWTAAHQAPLSMGFSRQEYWSGVPLPSLHLPWCRH